MLSAAVVAASAVAPAMVPAGKLASLPGLGLDAPAEGRALLGALVMLVAGAMLSLVRAKGRRSRVSRR